MALERFKGGRKSSREKLNAIVDVGKRLVAITGDETIYVVQTQHGTAIGVNVNTLAARMPKFGIHWAIATKPSVRTMDDCAWIRPENQYGVPTGTPYVYAYMSNSSGAGAPPGPLSSTFAADFLKIYLPGSGGQEPNIRDGDNITYYLSDGKLWIGPGAWYDDPIYTLKMFIEPSATPTIKPGWHLMDDEADDLRLPNTDVDTLGDIFDVHATATSSVNLASRFPYGMGANSDVGFSVTEAPAWTGKNRFAVLFNGGGAPEVEFGFFSTHYIARVN